METVGHHTVDLQLEWADLDEVYKDIVRISERDRGGLRAGKIHKFRVGKKSAYFILRGRSSKSDGYIVIDEPSRQKLGLKGPDKNSHRFTISEAGFFGELIWSLNAVDPSYRVAARLGVLSFVLGIIALLPLVWDVAQVAWDYLKCRF